MINEKIVEISAFSRKNAFSFNLFNEINTPIFLHTWYTILNNILQNFFRLFGRVVLVINFCGKTSIIILST